MFMSLSRRTLYSTGNADIITHHKPTYTGFLVRVKNVKMECKISTRTVGVFIVFNNRQYYNVRRSSNEQDA